MAFGDERLVGGQFFYRFIALVRGDQDFDVKWPKPELAHARLSGRHELFCLAAELFGFIDLSPTTSHFSKTSQRFEV